MKRILVLFFAVGKIFCGAYENYDVNWVKLTNDRYLNDSITAFIVIKIKSVNGTELKQINVDIIDTEYGPDAQVTSFGHDNLHDFAKDQILKDYSVYQNFFNDYIHDRVSISLVKKYDSNGRNTQIIQEEGPMASVVFDQELTEDEVVTAYLALKECCNNSGDYFERKNCLARIRISGAHNITTRAAQATS